MERIEIIGKQDYDDDGNLVQISKGQVFTGTVQLLGGDDYTAIDLDGQSRRVQVFAPSGIDVNENDSLLIRGEHYHVVYTPWDNGKHRRPANRRHKPSTVIIAERGEG